MNIGPTQFFLPFMCGHMNPYLGSDLINSLTSIGNPILEESLSYNHLISTMGIPGVTLCFQFVSIAISVFTAAAITFASRIKTVCATPSLFGEKESIGGGGVGVGGWGAVMLSFDVSFDASLNKLLNKQSRCRWIGMSWCSFDVTAMSSGIYSDSWQLYLRD